MKYTSRDLLWLCVLTAVAVAWFTEHRHAKQRRHNLNDRIKLETERRLGPWFDRGLTVTITESDIRFVDDAGNEYGK